MNNFWCLVGFEYKKILKKKSIILTLILALVLIMFSCVGILIGSHYEGGKRYESNYEGMLKDRAFDRALSGRAIDSELLLETSKAYAKIPSSDNYSTTKEYEQYARKYSRIYAIMRAAYNTKEDRFELEDAQNLTKEQADNFYQARYEKIKDTVNNTTLSAKAKEKLLTLEEGVKKPFIMDLTDGYTRFFTMMYTTGIIACFVIAICLAPIFSGEYTSGADQLILTSKNGKKSLIAAKLFTGVTLSFVICITFTLTTYFECMFVYGFDGANAPLQLYLPCCSYSLNMWQVAAIFSACVLFGNLFSAAITILLSSKFKTPFGVIIIISLIIVAPMFINISETNVLLFNLFSLVPTNMMALWMIIASVLFEPFGIPLQPYIFMPIFAGIMVVLILPFAYRGFKYHQIG
jgi:ABC-type transport system involved in multi-copper enzyme maturation permease subunit